MQIENIKFVRAADRDVGAALFLNGKVVAQVDYDSYGTAGESLLERMTERLAEMANIRAEYDEVGDDEFRDLTAG